MPKPATKLEVLEEMALERAALEKLIAAISPQDMVRPWQASSPPIPATTIVVHTKN